MSMLRVGQLVLRATRACRGAHRAAYLVLQFGGGDLESLARATIRPAMARPERAGCCHVACTGTGAGGSGEGRGRALVGAEGSLALRVGHCSAVGERLQAEGRQCELTKPAVRVC